MRKMLAVMLIMLIALPSPMRGQDDRLAAVRNAWSNAEVGLTAVAGPTLHGRVVEVGRDTLLLRGVHAVDGTRQLTLHRAAGFGDDDVFVFAADEIETLWLVGSPEGGRRQRPAPSSVQPVAAQSPGQGVVLWLGLRHSRIRARVVSVEGSGVVIQHVEPGGDGLNARYETPERGPGVHIVPAADLTSVEVAGDVRLMSSQARDIAADVVRGVARQRPRNHDVRVKTFSGESVRGAIIRADSANLGVADGERMAFVLLRDVKSLGPAGVHRRTVLGIAFTVVSVAALVLMGMAIGAAEGAVWCPAQQCSFP